VRNGNVAKNNGFSLKQEGTAAKHPLTVEGAFNNGKNPVACQFEICPRAARATNKP